VQQAVAIWQDWRLLKVLPFGGLDVMAQPAWVLQLLRACEAAAHEAEASQAKAKDDDLRQQRAEAERAARRMR